ncbi:MAG TPA: hypothetical protein VGC93_13040 [Thermoanaerobaculia bacterium]
MAPPPPAPTLTVGLDLAADVAPPADEELVGLAVVVAGEHAGWTECAGPLGAPKKSFAAAAKSVPKVGIGVAGWEPCGTRPGSGAGAAVAYYAVSLGAPPAAAPGATINNSKSNNLRISLPHGSVDVEIATDPAGTATWPASGLVVAAQVARPRDGSLTVVLAPAQCASAPPP